MTMILIRMSLNTFTMTKEKKSHNTKNTTNNTKYKKKDFNKEYNPKKISLSLKKLICLAFLKLIKLKSL